jgi:GTP-binding protein
MSKKLSFPKVLLVGRTNVGKSTIFNRLVGEKKSIVLEQEHVTRDYVQETVTWADATFDLVDTGGLTFKKNLDDITQKIQHKVLNLFENASIILFICDIKQGITDEDRKIAKYLHKTGKPVFLFLNKSDNTNTFNERMHEFCALGFKDIFKLSAIHGNGIGDMLNLIVENLPSHKAEEVEEPSHKIAIIGKPNVGKSSLMNEIVRQERSIVSDIAGTTREAISHNMFYYSDLLQITDTAGVRKKARVSEDLETLMVKSSLSAIKESDTVVLMIDASQGQISDQEMKLLFYAYEQGKKILVVFNKIDLVKEYEELILKQDLDKNGFIFDKLPQIKMSCVTKKNVGRFFTELQKIWANAIQVIDPLELSNLISTELGMRHIYRAKTELKVSIIKQLKSEIPTFALHVNYPEHFGPTELGCIENILRKRYNFKGCPIKFVLKKDRGTYVVPRG